MIAAFSVYFNPRSPYGERLYAVPLISGFSFISIHAPLTGSDRLSEIIVARVKKFQSTLPLRGATTDHSTACKRDRFQSTLPLRGATSMGLDEPRYFGISIHAPLTGSDRRPIIRQKATCHFNPRSPYGERQFPPFFVSRGRRFQSTLPLRGATQPISPEAGVLLISIHAPLTGSDLKSWIRA